MASFGIDGFVLWVEDVRVCMNDCDFLFGVLFP